MTDEWRAAVAVMAGDWTTLTARRPIGWDDAMAAASTSEARLRSAGRWLGGPVTLMGVLGLRTNEVRHSAAIAWLLRPDGHHGLGDRVLGGVFAACFDGGTPDDLGEAVVEIEITRGPCRADIVVTHPAFTLVIENKVLAPESPRQCDILFEQFADAHEPMFILLSPLGRKPREATGDALEEFAALSYTTLAHIVDVALQQTAGSQSRGRPAAVEYMRSLRQEFC